MRQIEFSLPAYPRGYHVVTEDILSALGPLPEVGMVHVFIKHTSAAITINEAADPDVLTDFESVFNYIVPENLPFLVHTIEGPDDMPAHIKASIIGHSISIPISNYRLNLGTWQGIYLCEIRNSGGRRKFVASIIE